LHSATWFSKKRRSTKFSPIPLATLADFDPRKFSNQLEVGKIPDYNGEKRGPENFSYVGVKEEILRTKEKLGNKKKSVNFSFKEKFRTTKEKRKVRKISNQ
jgi:hypothetical protein